MLCNPSSPTAASGLSIIDNRMASPPTDSQTQATGPPLGSDPTILRYIASRDPHEGNGTFSGGSIATRDQTTNHDTYRTPFTTGASLEGILTQTDGASVEPGVPAPVLDVPLYDPDAMLIPIRHAISENSDEICVIGDFEGILYMNTTLVFVLRTTPIIPSPTLSQAMSQEEKKANGFTSLELGARIVKKGWDVKRPRETASHCLQQLTYNAKLGTWGGELCEQAREILESRYDWNNVDREDPNCPPRYYYNLRIDYEDRKWREAEKAWSSIEGSSWPAFE
jgi:hypothetical protein